MPSLISHGVIGLCAATAVSTGRPPLKLVLLTLFCAMFPDIDVVAFRLGIPYADFWGHRGFVHSLLFAGLVGMLITLLFYRRQRMLSGRWWLHLLFFSAVGMSHGLLDALTNGGLGIALLAPFDNDRYFFAVTPIAVSPLGVRRFMSDRGLQVLANEALWIWLPALGITLIGRYGFRNSSLGRRKAQG